MVRDEEGGKARVERLLTLPWNKVVDLLVVDLVGSRREMIGSHGVEVLEASEDPPIGFGRGQGQMWQVIGCVGRYRPASLIRPDRPRWLQVGNGDVSVRNSSRSVEDLA